MAEAAEPSRVLAHAADQEEVATLAGEYHSEAAAAAGMEAGVAVVQSFY